MTGSSENCSMACFDEVADLSFVEALYRIMIIAGDQLKKIGDYCEKTATAFFDAVMETTLQQFGFVENRKLAGNF